MTRIEAGPFLILGVDKDADADTLDRQLDERRAAASRGELTWTDDDLTWARDQLRDPARRIIADGDSLNIDIASGEVRRLARIYCLDGAPPSWEPMDLEPPAELPGIDLDPVALAADLPAPDVPLELPAVAKWLERYAAAGLDPWGVDLTG